MTASGYYGASASTYLSKTKIVLNRQSDLILDNASITSPVGIVIEDIAGLVSTVTSIDTKASVDMSTELSSRVSGDASINSKLSTEVSIIESNQVSIQISEAVWRSEADESIAANLSSELVNRAAAVSTEVSLRVLGDASIAANLSTETARIDAILIGASASSDNFAEIVTLINSVDTTNDDVFAGYVLSNNAALSTELVARESAVTAEASTRLANDDTISTNLSSELVARASADVSIAANLSTELVARASAVTAEASTRLANDNTIAANLSTELVARASADVSIAANLSTELVTRAAAVSTEVSLRVLGDTSIAANLSTELVARASGDASVMALLSATFSALPMSDGTTIIVDEATNTVQLKESVGAPASGTRTFAGLINVAAQPSTLTGFGDLSLVTKAYVSTADAAISTNLSSELVARASADVSIAANLSTELVARASADVSIAANLSTELVTRAAAVSTEVSLRAYGDASIAANLSTEKARIDAILIGASASSDNFAEIVTLINSVDTTNDQAFAGYVLANDAALSSELVARASGDASIAANLSTELVDRIAAVSTEVVARISGDTSLALDLSSEISNRIVDVDAEQTRAESAELSLSNLLGVDLTNEASIRLAADNSIATNLSSELVNRESAVSTEVSLRAYGDASIAANLSSELVRAQSAEESIAYTELYTYNRQVAIGQVPNSSRTSFTLATPVKYYSESIFMNGLLLEAGDDYNVTYANGMITGFVMTFVALTGDKLNAYGVCFTSQSLYE